MRIPSEEYFVLVLLLDSTLRGFKHTYFLGDPIDIQSGKLHVQTLQASLGNKKNESV